MLRLFYRLFLRLLIGLIAFGVLINYLVEPWVTQENQRQSYELARGQIYQLQQYFNPLPVAERAAALQRLQVHFGIGLSLHRSGSLALSEQEQQRLAAGQFVLQSSDGLFNTEDSRFIVPLSHGQWLQLQLQPNPAWLVWATLVANLALIVGFALLLWHWSKRHWRDLAQLGAAARDMGQGRLDVRANLPRRSDLYELAKHFDQMAAQLELLVSQQNEMIHGVAHELRTPMARMAFELDLLAASTQPDEQQQLQAELRSELHELDQLISEMLSYCRLQQQTQSPQTVAAEQWLASALADAQLEAEHFGVSLLGQATVSDCQMEPRLMARALSNLLRNALRYAQQRVEVRFEATDAGWRITVDDDGPGIAPDDRLKVFEPFTRLDESRNRASGGFGLGLAVVRRIAQWHGGSVSASQSALGGARIELIWPKLS